MTVFIENINGNESELKLKLKTFDLKTGNPVNFTGKIDVLKDDTLYIRLISDTIINKSPEIVFDSIPKGFKLVYPENVKRLPLLTKKDNLKFILSSTNTFYNWTYNPFFSTKKGRWLFDENGKQMVEIHCEYEPWLFGSDLITVKMNKEYQVVESNLMILDENDKAINFELKQKRNPTNKFALKLKKKLKTGQKIKIILHFNDKNHYEEIIEISKKNSIGIMGKYNNL